MKKIIKAIKWIVRSLFFISIAVFVVFYLRWFRLTPFVFMDDPTYAFVGGTALLFIYTILVLMTTLSAVDLAQQVIFYGLAVPLLVVNIFYLRIHIPSLGSVTQCNGVTYYITYGAPLFDEQWTYIQVSEWRGISYESHFWGYSPGAGANEIICDVERKEAHFIRTYSDPSTLIFIDGENPQGFYQYASARLKDRLYFIAEDWSIENCTNDEYWSCDISVYTLYTCGLDYTDCNPLPVTYTSGDVKILELRANEITNEVSLFKQYLASDEETLIFTYGENSQCYVDGCVINK